MHHTFKCHLMDSDKWSVMALHQLLITMPGSMHDYTTLGQARGFVKNK